MCLLLAVAAAPCQGSEKGGEAAREPAAGEVMRLCRVRAEAGPGVVEMVLKSEDGEEALFLSKTPAITERDVAKAEVDSARTGVINVRLTEEAGEKLLAATTDMEKGVERLAIVVEGVLIAAPVVQSTLSSRFIIQGFAKADRRELERIAARMMGDRKPVESEPEVSVPAPK